MLWNFILTDWWTSEEGEKRTNWSDSASDELFLSGLENLTSAVAESFAKLLQESVVVNPIGYFV